MMQSTIPQLVEILADEHLGWIDGRMKRQGALLEQLRSAVGSSSGGTASGRTMASQHSALNLGAFEAWEDISARIASMFNAATDERPGDDASANLRGWLHVWDLADRRGEITDVQRDTQRRRLTAIVERIRNLLDPPRVKEIQARCPNPECGERWWYTDTRFGDRTSALYVRYRPDEPLVLRCHWCESEWDEDELDDIMQMIRLQDALYGA